MVKLSQSSLIAFYLFAAFIVFVTVRGELGLYVGFFTGAGSSNTTPANSSASSSDALTAAQSALLEGAQLAIIA